MSGYDNGTCTQGIVSQAKQFGSILRGLGPPVPQAGVLGDLYLDTLTWQLFEKRASEQTDPWGHYLFVVPATYRNSLKFFTAAGIGDDVGMPGDYALLWAGYANYGLQPYIFGPKAANGWPENGNGPGTHFDPAFIGFALAAGIVDEGPAVAYSSSTQLVVVGLTDEFILAIPAAPVANGPVSQVGVQGQPVNVTVQLNPLYTAEDGLAVGATNIVPGEQNNVAIAAAGGTGLTVPDAATYALVTAVNGTMYATYDGSAPSPTNYAIAIGEGGSLPVRFAAMSAIKLFGTQMSVSYWN